MRTELSHPPRTIRISATGFRTHIFELAGLVDRYGCPVVIVHRGKDAYQFVADPSPLDTDASLISPGLLQAITARRRPRSRSVNPAAANGRRAGATPRALSPSARPR
jgi:hypothetical protein